MTKSILNLIGYVFSFLLGCVFTVNYVDIKLEDLNKPVQEVVKTTVEKVALPTEVKPWENFKDTFELSIQLPEVTVYGEKKVVSAEKDLCIQKIGELSNQPSDVYAIPTTVERLEPSLLIEKVNTTLLESTINLTSSIEAKARSPGLAIVDNGTNTNLLNKYDMLRKDKRNLKSILRMLFAGNKYFKVKDDGTIIIKKHWYSQKKVVTSVQEIVNQTIPKVMIALSKDLAEDYMAAIIDVEIKNTGELIEASFSHFSNFCTEVGYRGKLLEFDFELPLIKRKYIRTKIIFEEKLENLKQLDFNSLFVKVVPRIFDEQKVKNLQSLPSKSLVSLQTVLNQQIDEFKFRKVGICTTGSPDIDSGMAKVYRLI